MFYPITKRQLFNKAGDRQVGPGDKNNPRPPYPDLPTAGGRDVDGSSLEDPTDVNNFRPDENLTTVSGLNASDDETGNEAPDRTPLEESTSFGRADGETREQMDHELIANSPGDTMAAPDFGTDDDIDDESDDDLRDTYFNSRSADDLDDEMKEKFAHAEKGSSTGSFTDLGEGRSSVIRRAKPTKKDHH